MSTQTRPLMSRVPNLDHTPEAARWFYEQDQDGTWYIARLPMDHPSYQSHLEAVANGTITPLPNGTTKESHAATAAEQAEKEQAIAKEIAAAEKRWTEHNAVVAQQREAVRQAQVRADQERARLGMLTSSDFALLRTQGGAE